MQWLLLFIGRAYANDPHQLTILVMSKSYVCTVYNRLTNITEIRPATATASFFPLRVRPGDFFYDKE